MGNWQPNEDLGIEARGHTVRSVAHAYSRDAPVEVVSRWVDRRMAFRPGSLMVSILGVHAEGVVPNLCYSG